MRLYRDTLQLLIMLLTVTGCSYNRWVPDTTGAGETNRSASAGSLTNRTAAATGSQTAQHAARNTPSFQSGYEPLTQDPADAGRNYTKLQSDSRPSDRQSSIRYRLKNPATGNTAHGNKQSPAAESAVRTNRLITVQTNAPRLLIGTLITPWPLQKLELINSSGNTIEAQLYRLDGNRETAFIVTNPEAGSWFLHSVVCSRSNSSRSLTLSFPLTPLLKLLPDNTKHVTYPGRLLFAHPSRIEALRRFFPKLRVLGRVWDNSFTPLALIRIDPGQPLKPAYLKALSDFIPDKALDFLRKGAQ